MNFATAETKWGNAINRLHDTGQLPVIPPAHLWVATIQDYDAKQGWHIAVVPTPTGSADKPTAHVYVNAGVWRTLCPLCREGQHASRDDFFYCHYCRNEQAGGRVLPQKWPPNPDQIEKTLEFRPHRKYRHWHPGETIEQLRRQDLKAIRAGLHIEGTR